MQPYNSANLPPHPFSPALHAPPDHLHLSTEQTQPGDAMERMVILQVLDGVPSTSYNLKSMHRMEPSSSAQDGAIFICRYAESLPRQIRGPALNNDAFGTTPSPPTHLLWPEGSGAGSQLYVTIPSERGAIREHLPFNGANDLGHDRYALY